MLGAIGQGWTTTLLVGLRVGSLAIVQRGTKWRAETKAKEEKKRDESEEKKRRKEENAVAALASGNSGAVAVEHEGKNIRAT